MSEAPHDPHLDRLRAIVGEMGSVLVCYSGGVDSAFVLAVAHDVLGARAIGMTAVSASLAPAEKELAVSVATRIGARHELVESGEIDDPDYAAQRPRSLLSLQERALRHLDAQAARVGRRVRRERHEPRRSRRLPPRPRGREAAPACGARSSRRAFTKSDVRRVAAGDRPFGSGTSPPRRASRAAFRTEPE